LRPLVYNDPNNIIYDIDYATLVNRNILVVEDNKINQMITKKILKKNKMICFVIDNRMDIIKMAQERNFDAVLMDRIKGIETTLRIREFDDKLPIIALKAVTIDENLDNFY
jgi:CheY-like chemotaxis protein